MVGTIIAAVTDPMVLMVLAGQNALGEDDGTLAAEQSRDADRDALKCRGRLRMIDYRTER